MKLKIHTNQAIYFDFMSPSQYGVPHRSTLKYYKKQKKIRKTKICGKKILGEKMFFREKSNLDSKKTVFCARLVPIKSTCTRVQSAEQPNLRLSRFTGHPSNYYLLLSNPDISTKIFSQILEDEEGKRFCRPTILCSVQTNGNMPSNHVTIRYLFSKNHKRQRAILGRILWGPHVFIVV